MQDGKTGNGLIQEGAMKGNGLRTGLTSQATLHRSLQRRQSGIESFLLPCAVLYQILAEKEKDHLSD